jgi:acyl-CoA thioesterase FadM
MYNKLKNKIADYFNIRLPMAAYKYKTVVTMGEVNIFQNMYFANYFKLQGVCRELFVAECINDINKIFSTTQISILTRKANMSFIKDFTLFDKIVVEMDITHIGKHEAELRFKFFEQGCSELRAEGIQVIEFIGLNDEPCEIPKPILFQLRKFRTDLGNN